MLCLRFSHFKDMSLNENNWTTLLGRRIPDLSKTAFSHTHYGKDWPQKFELDFEDYRKKHEQQVKYHIKLKRPLNNGYPSPIYHPGRHPLIKRVRSLIQSVFDFLGLRFLQSFVVGLKDFGKLHGRRNRYLQWQQRLEFFNGLTKWFRRSLWFLTFSSIYIVSPVLGLMTVSLLH